VARPTFDAIVVTLSEYHQTLKKIHEDEDAFDLSDDSPEEDGPSLSLPLFATALGVKEERNTFPSTDLLSDEDQSNFNFSAWEERRMKEEIKAFIKQIAIEVGGDSPLRALSDHQLLCSLCLL